MIVKRHMAIFGGAIGAAALIAVAVAGVDWVVGPLWAHDVTLDADDQTDQEVSDGDFQPLLLGAPQKRVGAGSRQLSGTKTDPCKLGSADQSSDEVAKSAEVECESETAPAQ